MVKANQKSEVTRRMLDATDVQKIPDSTLTQLVQEANRLEQCKGAYDQVFPSLKNAWLDGFLWAIDQCNKHE